MKAAITLASCALLGSSSCGDQGGDPSPTPPLPTVISSEVRSATIPIYEDYVGKTEPELFVEIWARVDGFMQEVLFEDGALVEKGTPLFEIDPRKHEARVAVLEGALQQDQAQLDRAQHNLERLEPLFEENAVSRKDYDDARADVDQAKAAHASGLAELKEEQLELEFCSIASPMAGVVGESAVDAGALVGSRGQSLLTVVQQIDPVRVRFNMTPRDLGRLNRSRGQEVEPAKVERWQSVTITLPDGEEYGFKGDVKFTDPEINPETGTFAVQAVLPNPNGILRPGQFTSVRLRLGWQPNAIFVPQSAVLAGQGGSYVLVITEDDSVEQRWVVVDRPWREDFVVRSGVEPGERVVAEGGHKLRSGQKVKVVEPPPEEEEQASDTSEGEQDQ